MVTSLVTILAKDDEVDIKRAALHGMKIKEANNKILLQTHAIADTGADTNCTDQTLRKVLGRDKLPDAPLGLKGAIGTNENKCKDKLRIITKDKEINVIEARSIEELGYTGPNSTPFLECVKKELNVNVDNREYFDFNERGVNPRILLGLKNGSLLAEKLSEEMMVKLKVKQPYLSPNLQVLSTPINSKLLITGSLGVDPCLVEKSSNYPRFTFLVEENMDEESIEEAINKEAIELESILNVKFKRENELEEGRTEKCLSVFKLDKKDIPNHFPCIPAEHGITEEEDEDNTPTPSTKTGFNVTEADATEEIYWSEEEEELKFEEEVLSQNHLLPPRVICSSDRVYLTAEETLILPEDINGSRSKEEEKMYYTRADAMKLEKFLQQEQNHLWKKPQQKCTQHSQRCEVCDLLSRRNSNRENELVQRSWDAVTAREIKPGKYQITNSYQYRHDTATTYDPSQSSMEEAKGHLLNEQVEKMVRKK